MKKKPTGSTAVPPHFLPCGMMAARERPLPEARFFNVRESRR
jgi:hypothetical protein